MTQLTLPGCAVVQLPLGHALYERGASDFGRYVPLTECPFSDAVAIKAWWYGWQEAFNKWLAGRPVDDAMCDESDQRYYQLLASGFHPDQDGEV